MADYNREKDRITIEQTFEELFQFEQSLDDGERRSLREGFDEESLATRNHLWSDNMGLPVDAYTDEDVNKKSEEVSRHVYRDYPVLPTLYYTSDSVVG
ncbi:MAG: hypothetical protein JAY90_21970 [Candidatus Thiodiazotropha lotti]|nr:hypothetical protein [Candidatus Thiodiazotropha lotti]